ncbi:hypothetical protein [Youngiibacter fragilis]|jgi:hypothetical protein|uniref:Uncharacterized protein n=1 Tax=Youngiibacter fragilis 232.1 TaxID=994573 RepID=V7I4C7_9CLOT|nr:hypothetical protein [Youngiibacter fragilis]ETA80733.1 hypothetical protein T472_0210225 [Youngiibacter fragilis 232.1]
MDKTWENDRCSPLQLKKIRNLAEKHGEYELTSKVEELTKGMAHAVIDDFLTGNLQRLLKAGVIREKGTEAIEKVPSMSESAPVHKFRYKVTEGGHLWNYTDFRLEARGTLVDFATDDRLILFQVIEVDHEIDEELIRKYGLKAELVNPK